MVRQAKRRAPILEVGLWFLTVGLLAGLAWYYFATEDPVEVERETLCPVERKHIPAYTASILDRTEEINEVQQAATENALNRVLKATEPFERLRLYEIVGRASLKSGSLITLCNPTRPHSSSSLDKKFNRDEVLERKAFEERFVKKFTDLLKTKLNVPPQQDSPIMEMIQAVNVKDLGEAPEKSRKRLILVSDMMQHSPDYSHYRTPPTKEFFESAFFKRIATDLSGVVVEIYYVVRAGGSSEQPRGHKEFWNQYFNRLGAVQVVIVPIEGAGWVQKDSQQYRAK